MSATTGDYNELVELLIEYRDAYEKGHAVIPDQVYDSLLSVAAKYERAFPQMARRDSPSFNVGLVLLNKDRIPHPMQMWSLSNSYDDERLWKFLRKSDDATYNVEYKNDGLGISLIYIHGRFEMALTRGDGKVGHDVTANVRCIGNIPKFIKTDVEVFVGHGEVFLTKASFANINKCLDTEKLKPYLNARAAASGILRAGNDFIDTLNFRLYEACAPELGRSYYKRMLIAKDMGFDTTVIQPPIKLEHVVDKVAALMELRKDLPFEVDGLVVKADSYDLREALGYGSKAPNFAIAVKFQAAKGVTTCEDIKFQVSGLGAVNPVAVLSPILVGGVSVSSATVHNCALLKMMDLRIGDYVEVSRLADVSNQITKVLTDRRPVDATCPIMPTHCPCCDKELTVEGGKRQTLRCTNTLGCREQVVERMKKYLSPAGVAVPVYRSVLEKLFETGKLKEIPDLYSLDADTLQAYGGATRKAAFKMLDGLRDAMDLPMEDHLAVLGIPTISYASALSIKEIAPTFGDLWNGILAKDSEAFMVLLKTAIGPVSAEQLEDWAWSVEGSEILKRMSAIVNPGGK